jgi:hypothetical protein
MFKYLIPFLVAVVSNAVMLVVKVFPSVGGMWNYLQLSDLGVTVKAFEAAPLWASVNIVLSILGVLCWVAYVVRN